MVHVRALRLLIILLCAAITFVGFAQEEEDFFEPEPDQDGTPGLVNALDELNLPPLPSAPDDAADTAPDEEEGAPMAAPEAAQPAPAHAPPILPTTPADPFRFVTNVTPPLTSILSPSNWPRLRARFDDNVTPPLTSFARSIFDRPLVRMRRAAADSSAARLPAQQSPDPVRVETDPDGYVYNTFADGSFTVVSESGTILLEGFFGEVGEGVIVAFATGEDGTRYAFRNGYFSAYTPEGDVIVGGPSTLYTYDYDEDGAFVGLSDSDGGVYELNLDEEDGFAITGPDGFEFYVDSEGDFELYDEAGELILEGALLDEDEEFSEDNLEGDDFENEDSEGDDFEGDDFENEDLEGDDFENEDFEGDDFQDDDAGGDDFQDEDFEGDDFQDEDTGGDDFQDDDAGGDEN